MRKLIAALLFTICTSAFSAQVPVEFPLCNGSLQYNNIAPCSTYQPELALSKSSGQNDYIEMTLNPLFVSPDCIRSIGIDNFGAPVQISATDWLWQVPTDTQVVVLNFQQCTANEMMYAGWKYY